jgi:hypothetical protein
VSGRNRGRGTGEQLLSRRIVNDPGTRLGHISGQGWPALRWALVEAAQHTPTGGGPLRASYERIAKRRGKQVAKVAVARKIRFYGLRDGEIRCLAPRVRAHTHESTGGRPATRRAHAVAAAPAGEADALERARVVSMASPRQPRD